MEYDLEEKVARFSEDIIDFLKTIEVNQITKPLITQLVRSSTSVGANYMKANQASSKKDFKNKITISKKEANESKHFIRMIAKADENKKIKCRELWKEAHELVLIFSSITKKCNESKN